MPSNCRSRLRLVSNSAKTPSISRKHLPAAGLCRLAVRLRVNARPWLSARETLAKDDHMIEALASDRADPSFGIAVLPRRSRRCRSVANAHRANAARKCLAVDTVAITNEVVRHRFPPAGLADLPGDPVGGWR